MNVLLQFYPGDRVAWIMTSVLIQTTLISAAALLFARCFARRWPALRHGVLACALWCCLVSPVLTMMFDLAGVGLVELPLASSALLPLEAVQREPTTGADTDVGSLAGMVLEDPFNEFLADEPGAPRASSSTPDGDGRQVEEWLAASESLRAIGGAFVAVWLAVGLVLLCRLLRGWCVVCRLRRDSRPLTEKRVAVLLQSVLRCLGMSRAPILACSANAPGPITVGTIWPVVLLPETLIDSANDRDLRHLLLHECAHVMRRDCLTGMIQRFAQILYWPHPLVHALNRQIAIAREEVCDNCVLLSSERTEYGRTLLELAELFRSRRVVRTAIGLLSRRGNLEQRIHGILDPRRTLMTRMRYSLSVGFMCSFLCVVVATAGIRVSFADAADHGEQEPAKKRPHKRAFDDARLNEAQRAYRDWTKETFNHSLGESQYADLTEPERAAKEREWIQQVSQDQRGREIIPAINGLAAIRSRKAVAALLHVAAERVEKDNRDRWMAVRALGLLGDDSVVPELVHLTYHYNSNTRFWAQISLVRLTEQNFGRDVAAWRKWWKESGKQPVISDEVVVWTTRKEWSDPETRAQLDQEWLARWKSRGDVSSVGAPRIVATSPTAGATDVDPAITEITATFDHDMGEGFSWTGGGEDFPPSPTGKKAHWRDKRTCVLPVELKAARYYRVGINSKSFQNFQSAAGRPAKPSAIYFATAGATEEVKNRTRKPQIVALIPPNGATDVDPGLKELRVTFNLPMGGGFSWTGGGAHFPKIPAGQRPRWSEDHKTCVLPVELKPNWEYRLGLNSPSHKNFQSAGGVPLEPILYTFKTREN
ncbi:MAG: M56 family metallopeptidase [Pirellulaceae bacterium]